MKLRVNYKEIKYKSFVFETSDYMPTGTSPKQEVLETAELINRIKYNPQPFCKENESNIGREAEIEDMVIKLEDDI